MNFENARLQASCLLAKERARLIFFFCQCLTWLESERNFSLKAVSGFELEKHCQALAILSVSLEWPKPGNVLLGLNLRGILL